LHSWKHDSHRILTEEGIQIDLSDKDPSNAVRSIRSSFEFDSNVIVERELHAPKHASERIVTEEGMQIDLSDEH
jgi:hypothetical protein